jgi:hypothetical protein
MEYHTDEEELSRETGWILEQNKNNNKRLLGNVATTEGGRDGTNPVIEPAEKGKTSPNNSRKLPGNV